MMVTYCTGFGYLLYRGIVTFCTAYRYLLYRLAERCTDYIVTIKCTMVTVQDHYVASTKDYRPQTL